MPCFKTPTEDSRKSILMVVERDSDRLFEILERVFMKQAPPNGGIDLAGEPGVEQGELGELVPLVHIMDPQAHRRWIICRVALFRHVLVPAILAQGIHRKNLLT